MAIKSTFTADFSSFSQAVQGAQLQLKGFEADTNKVGSALNRMVDNFSGRKVVTEATMIGEAFKRLSDQGIKLTGDELQKMGAIADAAIAKFKVMGTAVPKDIQAVSDAAKEATSSWSGFVENFDPKKAISDPLGTAVEGFRALAESIGPVGVIGGAAIGILAGLGTAAYKLAANAAEVGSKLGDLSDKTGVSVPALSRLSNASAVAGTTIDELSDAIFKMDVQASQGPEKFTEGLKKLGINAKDFLALNPEDRLSAFAAALNTTSDAAVRNAAGVEVMGKQFKDLEPKLMDLAKAMELTSDTSIWTPEQAAAAEDFSMQVKALQVQMADLGIAIGRDLLPPALAFLAFLKEVGPVASEALKRLFPFITAGREIGESFGWASAAWDLLRGNLNQGLKTESLEEATKKAKDLQDKIFDAARTPEKLRQQMLGPTKDLADSVGSLDLAWKELTRSNEDTVKATEKTAQAQKELNKELAKTALQEYIANYKEVGPSLKSFEDHQKIATGALDATTKAFGRQNDAIIRILPRFSEWHEAVTGLRDDNGNLTATVIDLGQMGMPGLSDAMQDVGMTTKEAREQLKQLREESNSLGSVLESSLGGLSDIFQRAFEGGGGVLGAIKSFATNVTKGLLDMIPVVGPILSQFAGAIVAGVSKIFGSFGGPSKDELAARDTFAKQFSSVNDAIDKVGTAYAKMGKTGAEAAADVQKALDATHVSAAAEAAALKVINDKLAEGAEQAKAFADATAHIDDAATGFNAVAMALGDNKESLEGLGRQAVTTFAAMLAAGKPFATALKAIGPGLDALRDSYKKLGITVGTTGLGILLMQQQIAKANPDLIAGVDGLASSLSALGGLGLVNEQSFKDMEKAGFDMYTRLQGETAALGGTTKDALLPMQEFLHKAKDEAEKLGVPLDANTQLLIDQSQELGIWKKDGVDPMLQGMKDMVKAVQDLVKALTGTGGATDAIKKVGKTADESIPDNPYKNWKMPEVKMPDVPGAPSQSTGSGGSVGGSSNLVAFPGRKVPLVTSSQQRAALSGGASGGPIEITLVTQLDGRVVAETVTRVQDNDQRLRRKIRAA